MGEFHRNSSIADPRAEVRDDPSDYEQPHVRRVAKRGRSRAEFNVELKREKE